MAKGESYKILTPISYSMDHILKSIFWLFDIILPLIKLLKAKCMLGMDILRELQYFNHIS